MPHGVIVLLGTVIYLMLTVPTDSFTLCKTVSTNPKETLCLNTENQSPTVSPSPSSPTPLKK